MILIDNRIRQISLSSPELWSLYTAVFYLQPWYNMRHLVTSKDANNVSSNAVSSATFKTAQNTGYSNDESQTDVKMLLQE